MAKWKRSLPFFRDGDMTMQTMTRTFQIAVLFLAVLIMNAQTARLAARTADRSRFSSWRCVVDRRQRSIVVEGHSRSTHSRWKDCCCTNCHKFEGQFFIPGIRPDSIDWWRHATHIPSEYGQRQPGGPPLNLTLTAGQARGVCSL